MIWLEHLLYLEIYEDNPEFVIILEPNLKRIHTT